MTVPLVGAFSASCSAKSTVGAPTGDERRVEGGAGDHGPRRAIRARLGEGRAA